MLTECFAVKISCLLVCKRVVLVLHAVQQICQITVSPSTNANVTQYK